jgi:hypothetical protein
MLLLQRSWTLQLAASLLLLLLRSWTLLLPGICNALVKLLDAAIVATATSWSLRRSCKTPATLLDAAIAVSWPLPSSCDTPGRCNCCFLVSATLLLRSQILLLVGLCNAPGRHNCCSLYFLASATLLQHFRMLQLLLPAFATLPEAATAVSWPLQRSCNHPEHCCFLASTMLLSRSWVVQPMQAPLPSLGNAPGTLL